MRRTPLAVGVAALATCLAVTTSSAWAWWTDTAPSTSTMTAYTVPAPQNFRCSALAIGSATLAWDAVPGATSYTVTVGSSTFPVTAPTTSYKYTNVLGVAQTASVVANVNYGSVTWTSASSNTKSVTVALLTVAVCL